MHYIAAILPHQDPVTDKFTIAQLREPQIAKRVGGVSTFYIPPKGRKVANPKIVQEVEVPTTIDDVYPPNQWEPSVLTPPPYGPRANAAISQLETHVVPEEYRRLATSKTMTDVMTQLALDPNALAKYKANHAAFVQSVPGLSAQEKAALETGNYWAIRCAMKDIPVSLLEATNMECGSSESAPIFFMTLHIHITR